MCGILQLHLINDSLARSFSEVRNHPRNGQRHRVWKLWQIHRTAHSSYSPTNHNLSLTAIIEIPVKFTTFLGVQKRSILTNHEYYQKSTSCNLHSARETFIIDLS